MAPQRPEPTDSSRKVKPSLDDPEPEITAMLEQYRDLRRSSFSPDRDPGPAPAETTPTQPAAG